MQSLCGVLLKQLNFITFQKIKQGGMILMRFLQFLLCLTKRDIQNKYAAKMDQLAVKLHIHAQIMGEMGEKKH